MSLTDKLKRLYSIDRQYGALRTRVTTANKFLNTQLTQLTKLQNENNALIDEIRHLQATATNTENDVRTIEEHIAKLREQMNQAQTDKQYKTFLKEINTLKVDKDKLESKALGEMTKVDELNEKAQLLAQQIGERTRIKEMAVDDLKKSEEVIADKVAELEEERKEAVKEIPAVILAEYEQLYEWMDGEPMASISEQDSKRLEYNCGSCYMQIPIERLSALMGQGDVTHCPSCRRFLYIGDELQEKLDKKFANK